MTTPELYEKARDYIFATDELRKEYAGFIEKADDFHYDVQLKVIDTMKELDEAGINFYNFTKYNFPEVPLYEGARAQGDADTTVFRQSFGATASDYNEVFQRNILILFQQKTLNIFLLIKKSMHQLVFSLIRLGLSKICITTISDLCRMCQLRLCDII
jgi:hypothetical protein